MITSDLGEPARQRAVRALLEAGANPDALDGYGTPVLNAYLDYTDEWDLELVGWLATPVSVRPRLARTALAIALAQGASKGDARAVVELLVERGVEVWRPSVLDAACLGGRLDLVRRAVEAGAAIPAEALHSAVHGDATDVVSYLLERGVDPNSGATVRAPILDVRSLATLEVLLAHGADPFVLTRDGETPLHVVASKRDIKVPELVALVQRLEQLGFSLAIPDAHGRTPREILRASRNPAVRALAG